MRYFRCVNNASGYETEMQASCPLEALRIFASRPYFMSNWVKWGDGFVSVGDCYCYFNRGEF